MHVICTTCTKNAAAIAAKSCAARCIFFTDSEYFVTQYGRGKKAKAPPRGGVSHARGKGFRMQVKVMMPSFQEAPMEPWYCSAMASAMERPMP